MALREGEDPGGVPSVGACRRAQAVWQRCLARRHLGRQHAQHLGFSATKAKDEGMARVNDQ